MPCLLFVTGLGYEADIQTVVLGNTQMVSIKLSGSFNI